MTQKPKPIVYLITCLIFASKLLWSQDFKDKKELFPTDFSLGQQLARPTAGAMVALDAPINPDEYLVGAGDGLSISITGAIEINYTLYVTPEGTLIIPTVGEVQINDLALTQAKEKIIKAINSKYLDARITVTLVSLRTFRVTVAGAVQKPGVYEANHAHRVSDIIFLAGGPQTPLTVSKKEETTTVETPFRDEITLKTSQIKDNRQIQFKTASQRNIRLSRKNGTTVHVDLERFKITGNNEINPRLWDGDNIYVPILESKIGEIGIYGAVRDPGEFEFAPGDDLGLLVNLSHGLTRDADSGNVELLRFQADGRTTKRIAASLAKDVAGRIRLDSSFPLQPDDRVFIRAIPKYHVKYQVNVEGEVQFPGQYPIVKDISRLSDVIKAAGGFTEDAALLNANLIRTAAEAVEDPEFERLKKMQVADMTIQEREYFKIKSRELIGGMGVDFEKLFVKGDSTQDIILQDRDIISIPARTRTVNVTGQVINPGLISYVPDMPLKHYIREAGGYSWNARKSNVRVIRAATREWERPRGNTIIELGDTIFVPEKPERDWWVIARDIIAVTAQVATILLVITQATK